MVENQHTRINYLEKREKRNERIILDMKKTLTEIQAELNSSRFDSFEENADRALNYHLDKYANKAEKAEHDSGRNTSVVPEEITKRTIKRESEKDRDIVQSRQRRVPEIVAFTAYLSHNIDHMGVGHHVVFDKILTNDGAGYNSYTGIFTVPVTGLYLFTYSVNDHYKKSMLQLVVDGSNIFDIIVDPDSDTEEAMSGNTAIIHVSQGQSVWIQE